LYSMSGEYSKVEELKLLMQFTAKNNMVTEFTEELFLAYVDRVTVVSRAEVMFELKCGLNLKERLVK
jgi:site-specific DNA recombinase